MYLGLAVCLICGLAAMWLAGLQSVIGGPMIGLFLGIIIYNAAPAAFIEKTKKGASWSQKYLLKLGIILVGGTLSFTAVLGVGLSALPLIIFNICVSFAAAFIIGRWMKVSGRTSALVGGGTAICGGTAIATLTPIVEADEKEMAYAMTAIFLFDILAALVWPYIAQAINLSPEQYGILGGLAISDTSSVTAAGGTFDTLLGSAASTTINGETLTGGEMAVIVKLTRTVMLVVVAIAAMLVSMFRKSRSGEAAAEGSFVRRAVKAFPIFVLIFLVMALLNTVIKFSEIQIGSLALSKLLSKGSKYFISVALVGVGYKIKLKSLFKEGLRPVLLGGCTWAAVALCTLVYVLVIM